VLFNCRTTLVHAFRAHFPRTFSYLGNRAILLGPSTPLPTEQLSICLAMALTYHRRAAVGGYSARGRATDCVTRMPTR